MTTETELTQIVESDGTRKWYWKKRLHRVDGPAIEWADGGEEWYCHGRRHRGDGPAVTSATGTRAWYWRGQLHREGGPAVIWSTGAEEWWRHGQRVDPLGASEAALAEAVEVFVERFATPTEALLAVARASGIAVAYVDRRSFAATAGRGLTDAEWQAVAERLDGFG